MNLFILRDMLSLNRYDQCCLEESHPKILEFEVEDDVGSGDEQAINEYVTKYYFFY
jgi:hypothetical protein